MLAQHAVISDIISRVDHTRKSALAEWLLTNFRNQSLSSSSSLVFLTISLLESNAVTVENQSSSSLVPPTVAISWLQNQSQHVCKLMDATVLKKAVCYNSFRRLHEFFATLRFVLLRCGLDEDALVQTFISPFERCFSHMNKSFNKDRIIVYMITCALEVLIAPPPPGETSAYYSLDGYDNRMEELKKLFTDINLPEISAIFLSELDEVIVGTENDVWTPAVRILLELSSAMHRTGYFALGAGPSSHLAQVLRYRI